MTTITVRSVRAMIYTIIYLCTLARVAVANVEKLLFIGPAPSQILNNNPTLSSLSIHHTLTPDEPSIRTNLDRIFPSRQSLAPGESSWVLLTNLTENRRYELRICWSALEPTSFHMESYILEKVLQNAQLLKSINTYSASRRSDQARPMSVSEISNSSSALLVEVRATADYFTDVKELMSNPRPVLVDLILDPFLLNVLPQSLLPTAGYLILLCITTWFMAQWIATGLRSVAGPVEAQAKKRN
ncbi:hypothetical protein QQS21_011505 [Conoideocrella luteorostrata]|uniref:Uncharacterized protein n=1 Tax=Conoideocrella luteorostrata TaxID=1105319 RepID=A0AAJ0CDA1_9HYPO|nr:hypothetical protein QQS21_011505 [Conoideocrella luteorostrata]